MTERTPEPNRSRTTPSHLYDEAYFLTDCEGHESFGADTEREATSRRLAASLQLADLQAGDRVLDIGCGRGEIVMHCTRQGVAGYGVDFSADALRIAHMQLESREGKPRKRSWFSRADAKRLPFANGSFTKLLMFDLVEHLYPWELDAALREACRVLAAGGKLIIHTAPNRWYYRFGYPLYRLFERMRGRKLPANPRDRFPFHHLHVNEQDVLGMSRSLRRAGFAPKIQLENVTNPLQAERSPVLRLLIRFLMEVYPFRWVFRNDIFAVAKKRGQE